MLKTAILILAAGSSSRMGKAKQLLPYKHTTLLGWSIEQAQRSKADEVICMLGANVEEIRQSIKSYNIKTIYNQNYKEGLGSSIVNGIKELQDKDAVFVILADQPKITSVSLDKFLAQSNENPSKIVVSNYGKKVGVPAIFPKKYFEELKNLQGDKGARDFLNQLSEEIIKINTIDLVDIDTQDDYQNLIQ